MDVSVVYSCRICSFYDHAIRGITDTFDVSKARGFVYGLSKSMLSLSSRLPDVWLRLLSPHNAAELRRRKEKYLEVHAMSR